MNTNTTHMLIFSVYQNNQPTAINFKNHMLVSSMLTVSGLNFKELAGFYKGAPETSFAVFATFDKTAEILQKVINIAKRYNQEAVLYVDNEHNAYLDNLHGGQEKLGKFVEVPATDYAVCQGDHSLDLSTGKYYVIK